MSFPVVIATNGLGIPVVPVTENAPTATVAANGLGAPIVIATNGLGAPLILLNYTAATGALSWAGNAEDGETITIGATVYTFVAVLADAYDVLIGASASLSIANLIAAINHTAGEGTTYGTGTLINPDVSAATVPGIMNVTAKVVGPAGNSIVTESTVATATWGASTLQGGQ